MNSFYCKISVVTVFSIFLLWGQGEFLIDSTFIGGTAADDQRYPSIAFDGVNYMVVWADERSSQSSDIFGTRITSDGTILDSCGIAITTAAGDQVFPSVAFDGVNYFVVWTSNYGIYGARITQEGHVLDSDCIILATSYARSGPCVAYDGENYLVVWNRLGSLVGKRVSPSGVVLDSLYITITTHCWGAPSIAYGSSNYFVVWRDSRNYSTADSTDIYGARVSPGGIVLDTAGIAISAEWNHQSRPSVAYDGTNFFTVWEDYGDEIYGARIDQSGTLLDTVGIEIAPFLSSHPVVTYGFGYYFVAYHFTYNLVGARVDTSGIVVDTSRIPIAHGTLGYELGYPAVISGNDNYYVVWHKEDAAYFDIYGTEVTPAGQVVHYNGILLSTSTANTQWNSALAFDGTDYLAVWTDNRSNPYGYGKIRGRRVSSSSVLGPVIPISGGSIYVKKDYPATAFDSTNYLVVWQGYGIAGNQWDIYGTLVTPDGVVIPPEILITTSSAWERYPTVAFGDTNYLVAWEKNAGYGNIEATRVDQNGTVLDPVPIAIATNYYSEMSPAVAFDGTNYLVVWEDERDWASSDIYGTRISRSGEILDPGGFRISGGDVCRNPAVVFDGSDYFVVWQLDNSIPMYCDIYGARVSPSGTVVDSDILILHTTWGDCCPVIVFDGENYIVAWEYHVPFTYTSVVGARVDTAGTVIDSIIFSEQPGDQFSPAMIHGQDGQILMTYTGWADSINTYPINTMRIWGKYYLTGIDEDVESDLRRMGIGMQIYPNPINGAFSIEYYIPRKMHVSISVIDITGRLLKRIVGEIQDAGYYHKAYEMPNFAQGVYFVRLSTDENSVIRKAVIVR